MMKFRIDLQEQITSWNGELKINREKTDHLASEVTN